MGGEELLQILFVDFSTFNKCISERGMIHDGYLGEKNNYLEQANRHISDL
jgi:hypothetical protein